MLSVPSPLDAPSVKLQERTAQSKTYMKKLIAYFEGAAKELKDLIGEPTKMEELLTKNALLMNEMRENEMFWDNEARADMEYQRQKEEGMYGN